LPHTQGARPAKALIVNAPTKLLFLPGASGDIDFWTPLAASLRHPSSQVHFGWPGFGPTRHDPSVAGIDDLVEKVVAEIDQPTAIIAQSMGGVIALQAASRRAELVTHLVLTVTSGGIDLQDLAAQDWRPAFLEANPSLPRWFAELRLDLTNTLPSINVPSLLLWGDADPISPVAVGERLASLLPQAVLHVIPGGKHDLGKAFAEAIAPLIASHLKTGLAACPTGLPPRRR
jgi:pimeloyl-ACP methyl ester carboxylesterase